MSDAKIAYGVSADLTITLASLATSADHTVGRESTAIDNSSNLFLDYLLGGKITTGTSPTDAKSIRVYVYGQVDDAPVYPDVFDGTDSAETVTSATIRDTCLKLAAILATNDTSDRTYWLPPISILNLFGGLVLPQRWGAFITHDTGVNLNSTGSNQALWATGIYQTIV